MKHWENSGLFKKKNIGVSLGEVLRVEFPSGKQADQLCLDFSEFPQGEKGV